MWVDCNILLGPLKCVYPDDYSVPILLFYLQRTQQSEPKHKELHWTWIKNTQLFSVTVCVQMLWQASGREQDKIT